MMLDINSTAVLIDIDPLSSKATLHANAVAETLSQLGHEPILDAAARLLFNHQLIAEKHNEPKQIAEQAEHILHLATQLRPLLESSKTAGKNIRDAKAQVEQLRRMVLAMSTDLRGVLIALAYHLVCLRQCVENNISPDNGTLQEVLQIFSPLANRLGVWQLKWELEDLAFRFSNPERYHQIDIALNAKRDERQAIIEVVCNTIHQSLNTSQIEAQVYGRPKHIYSIANKMKAKHLSFEGLYDLRAVRVIVDNIRSCYTALGIIHDVYTPIPKEFDDYIARPKTNGYQSLHTVIVADDGKPIEVQIRTIAMHTFAEFGVAAHWRYKEGSTGKSSPEEARIAWLRQLLAWKKDLSDASQATQWKQIKLEEKPTFNHTNNPTPPIVAERIFCLTPAGRVIELVDGSTPIDFAYALHTELGHRCRGAKVNGHLVPLNTRLLNGQTVTLLPDRRLDASPSKDWLNPNLGYTASPRSRSKIRAWFNALALDESLAQGRSVIERELARLGKTASNTPLGLSDLAQKMGFKEVNALFIAAYKSDFHVRSIETALLQLNAEQQTALNEGQKQTVQDYHAIQDELAYQRIQVVAQRIHNNPNDYRHHHHTKNSDVWVVGVDKLLTQVAQCCHPVPPDSIMGYITRGKGVSLHRSSCPSLNYLANKHPERLIECAWSDTVLNKQPESSPLNATQYTVEVHVVARERSGLVRDIGDAFSKHKLTITALKHRHYRSKSQSQLWLTVLIDTIHRLNMVLNTIREIEGVHLATRR